MSARPSDGLASDKNAVPWPRRARLAAAVSAKGDFRGQAIVSSPPAHQRERAG